MRLERRGRHHDGLVGGEEAKCVVASEQDGTEALEICWQERR